MNEKSNELTRSWHFAISICLTVSTGEINVDYLRR